MKRKWIDKQERFD